MAIFWQKCEELYLEPNQKSMAEIYYINYPVLIGIKQTSHYKVAIT